MQTLPNDLLCDIRSFYADFTIVNDTYSTLYNQQILLYDLIDFINAPHIEMRETTMCLWGKLNPSNRNWFINQYILETDDL